MESPPKNAAELVQRVRTFAEWLYGASPNVRVEVVTAMLKACRLDEMPRLKGIVYRLIRIKSVLRDRGENVDEYPVFTLSPHMGIQFYDDVGMDGGDHAIHAVENDEDGIQGANNPVAVDDEGFDDDENENNVQQANGADPQNDGGANGDVPAAINEDNNEVDEPWNDDPVPLDVVPPVPVGGKYEAIMYWLARVYPDDRRQFLHLAIDCCHNDHELRFVKTEINSLIRRRREVGFLGWPTLPLHNQEVAVVEGNSSIRKCFWNLINAALLFFRISLNRDPQN